MPVRKAIKTNKMVRTRVAKERAATKAKHNKGAIMAKIEANIRRKVKTYLPKQKRGLSWSRYNNSTRRKKEPMRKIRN